ncbi:type II secretion system protein N [Zooshikella sp. RANM57]|uniref:type II secretion system protein N n=1 Tax=Zooshikella sp. RANM57 TaxID=3425863 RepID=UPI003D6F3145
MFIASKKLKIIDYITALTVFSLALTFAYSAISINAEQSPVLSISSSLDTTSFQETTIQAPNYSNTEIPTNLFGVVTQDKKVVMPKVEPKETKLAITLEAVFHSSKETDSVAVVKVNKNDEKLVKVGDEIQAGIIIKNINKSQIVFSHNGSLERLAMADYDQSGKAGSMLAYQSSADLNRANQGSLNLAGKTTQEDKIRARLLNLRSSL